jgi:hypothetical protein
MSILLRVIVLSMLAALLHLPLSQPGFAAVVPAPPVSDVVLLPPTVQLYGHVTMIDVYSLSSGCYAVIELRNTPGKTVVVRLADDRLQSLLETALATGNLISFVGQRVTVSSPPRGGSWNMDAYAIDEIALYNKK